MLCLRREIPEIVENWLKESFFTSNTHDARIKITRETVCKIGDDVGFHGDYCIEKSSA